MSAEAVGTVTQKPKDVVEEIAIEKITAIDIAENPTVSAAGGTSAAEDSAGGITPDATNDDTESGPSTTVESQAAG